MSNKNKTAIGIITGVRAEYCGMCAEDRRWSMRITGECPYMKPKPAYFSIEYDELPSEASSEKKPIKNTFLDLLHDANWNSNSGDTLHSDSLIGAIVNVDYESLGGTMPDCLLPKEGMVYMDAENITILHELMRK